MFFLQSLLKVSTETNKQIANFYNLNSGNLSKIHILLKDLWAAERPNGKDIDFCNQAGEKRRYQIVRSGSGVSLLPVLCG